MKDREISQKLADIIEPASGYNPGSKFYDWFMLIMIVLSIIPLMSHNENTFFLNVISIITSAVFCLDFTIRCYTSSTKRDKPFYKKYPFTFLGIVDFISILPVLSVFNYKLTLFKLFRLTRIVALLKFTRYTDKDEILLRVIKEKKDILLTVLLFAFLYIFITALIMFNVEPHYNPQTGEERLNSFFDALYWSTVTLTTVGYGDLCPVSICGRAISMVSSVFGIGFITTVSGVITSGLLEELGHTKNNRQDSK